MDPYIQQNRSLDTDLLILRSLFALDPNTNLPISTNYILSTDGLGGLVWTDPLILGGISFPILQSTTIGLGTIGFVSTSKLDASLTSTSQGLGTLSYVSTSFLNTALASTTQGLTNNIGNSGYISTSGLDTILTSTTIGLGSLSYVSTSTLDFVLRSTTSNIFNPVRYISSGNLISTTSGLLNNSFFTTENARSTVAGLGTVGYISTAQFVSTMRSTVAGLGTAGYVSTATLNLEVANLQTQITTQFNTAIDTSLTAINSTSIGLGTIDYVSGSRMIAYVTNAIANSGTTNSNVSTSYLDAALRSTINGLGTFRYVSSASLVSTTGFFLDSSRYVSTGALISTTAGIIAGQTGTLSNAALTSTVTGLGTVNYVSTASLQSTVAKLLDVANSSTFITIDRAGSVNVYAPTTINNVAGSIIYVSTFLTSSIRYSGTNGTISGVILPNPNTGTDLLFSTGIVPFAAFSSFIDANSRISLDIFPTFAFNELNTMATKSLITPMSTFIQCANFRLSSTNTSWLIANSKTVGFSNYFQQQIKLNFLGSDIIPCYTSSYILYHHLPNGMTINLDPGLKASSITVQYGSTNSIFVSVQNYA
jgi:hypothetical protein